jgi:hypothetical protein
MSRHLELQKKYSRNKKKESEKFSKDLGKPKVKITKGSTPTSTKVIRNKKLDVVIVMWKCDCRIFISNGVVERYDIRRSD